MISCSFLSDVILKMSLFCSPAELGVLPNCITSLVTDIGTGLFTQKHKRVLQYCSDNLCHGDTCGGVGWSKVGGLPGLVLVCIHVVYFKIFLAAISYILYVRPCCPGGFTQTASWYIVYVVNCTISVSALTSAQAHSFLLWGELIAFIYCLSNVFNNSV